MPTAPKATRRTIPAPNVIEVPDSPVLAAPATADLTAVVSAYEYESEAEQNKTIATNLFRLPQNVFDFPLLFDFSLC